MRLINQSAQYLPQETGIDGIYKQIELAGRTSYLSWDKMTDDSAKKFVDMLIKSKHTSVLEHGTVYLKIPTNRMTTSTKATEDAIRFYSRNPYSKVKYYMVGSMNDGYEAYVTTNMRVIIENNRIDDLNWISGPWDTHEKRLSVKVVTSRSISHELVRHRSMSFIQESQRYVGYDRDKFGGEITYILPTFASSHHNFSSCRTDEDIQEHVRGVIEVGYSDSYNYQFLSALEQVERSYMKLLSLGLKPQEAREVLPNATKTTLVITAFESDWREWFAQRLFGKTGEPHPQIKQLAELIKEEFEKAGVWEGIMKYPSKYD